MGNQRVSSPARAAGLQRAQIIDSRLHDKYRLVLPRLLHDQVAGVEAAGLLVAVEEHADGFSRHQVQLLQSLDGEIRHDDAALHIQYTGTEGLTIFYLKRHGLQRSHRVHCVIVPHKQNTLGTFSQFSIHMVSAGFLGEPLHPETKSPKGLLQESAAFVGRLLVFKGGRLQLHKFLEQL